MVEEGLSCGEHKVCLEITEVCRYACIYGGMEGGREKGTERGKERQTDFYNIK